MLTLNADDFLEDLFSYDLSLNDLQHVYDPVKAREYYLKTRELKGRRKGVVKSPVGRETKTPAASAKNRAVAKAAAKKAKNQRLKKIAEARVAKLKARLEKLEKILDELVKQAKARSGVETKSKTSDQKTEKASQDAKPLTPSEKREAAKKAKERYEKEKDKNPTLSDEAKAIEAKIRNAQERIINMRVQIAAAKKKAQPKSKPNGESNNKRRRTAVDKSEERR